MKIWVQTPEIKILWKFKFAALVRQISQYIHYVYVMYKRFSTGISRCFHSFSAKGAKSFWNTNRATEVASPCCEHMQHSSLWSTPNALGCFLRLWKWGATYCNVLHSSRDLVWLGWSDRENLDSSGMGFLM